MGSSANLRSSWFARITVFLMFVLPTSGYSQEPPVSLRGIIDFHAHSGPDSRPRAFNDIEMARLAKKSGLRGVVLKNHFTMTADRAAIAMSQVDGLEIFGGVALNRAVGGINPEAVRQMVAFDGGRGKVVWLPTFDSEFHVTRAGNGGQFVQIIAEGEPVAALLTVFELIAEHDLVLAMGHSSPEEVLQLIPVAKNLGVQKILVTHVFGQDASWEQMRLMAAQGAIMELEWLALYSGNVTLEDYVGVIRTIGAENFLISTDLGQSGNPDHGTGMASFIRALQRGDVTSNEIVIMAIFNPAKLLGIKPFGVGE